MRTNDWKLVLLFTFAPLTGLAQTGMPIPGPANAVPPPVIEVTHSVRRVGDQQFLVEGDRLDVAVTAAADVFVYVVHQDVNGEMALLYPNFVERENVVVAGDTRQIPGGKSGLVFRVRPPHFGREAIRVIASARPLVELEQEVDQAKEIIPTFPAKALDDLCRVWDRQGVLLGDVGNEFETRPKATLLQYRPVAAQ
jgi:hypothetical protein